MSINMRLLYPVPFTPEQQKELDMFMMDHEMLELNKAFLKGEISKQEHFDKMVEFIKKYIVKKRQWKPK